MTVSGEIKLKWSDGYWYEPQYEGMAGHMEWWGEVNNITMLTLKQYHPNDRIFGSSITEHEGFGLFIPEDLILQEAQKFAESYLAEWFKKLGLTVS